MMTVSGEGSRGGGGEGVSYIRGPTFCLNRGPAWSKSGPAATLFLFCDAATPRIWALLLCGIGMDGQQFDVGAAILRRSRHALRAVERHLAARHRTVQQVRLSLTVIYQYALCYQQNTAMRYRRHPCSDF